MLPYLTLPTPTYLATSAPLWRLAAPWLAEAASWAAEPALALVALAPVVFFGALSLFDRVPAAR